MNGASLSRVFSGGITITAILGLAACSASGDDGRSGIPMPDGTSPGGTLGSNDPSSAGPGTTQGGLFDTSQNDDGTVQIDGECAAVTEQATNQPRPVDIIWALDTSDSMVAELWAVQENMNLFAQTILNQGIDVHVVIIANPGRPDGTSGLFNPDPGVCIGPMLGTGACPGGSQPPVYLHDEVGVGSHSALSRFIDRYPTYKSVLRQNAVKYFAVVSDDDAEGYDAASFTAAVQALEPGWFDYWKFFGIFCTGGCPDFISCASTGRVYNDLVTQTGGLAGDLCMGNTAGFPPVFDALAQTVIGGTTLQCEWAIPAPPPGEVFDKDKVNVQYSPQASGVPRSILYVDSAADCGPEGGWYYDNPSAPTKIHVCPSDCNAISTDLQARMDILFGCDTIPVIR